MKNFTTKLKTKLDWLNSKQIQRIRFSEKESIDFKEGLFVLSENVLYKTVDGVKIEIEELIEDNYVKVFDRIRKQLDKELKAEIGFNITYNNATDKVDVKSLYSGTGTITKAKDVEERKDIKFVDYKKAFRKTDIAKGEILMLKVNIEGPAGSGKIEKALKILATV